MWFNAIVFGLLVGVIGFILYWFFINWMFGDTPSKKREIREWEKKWKKDNEEFFNKKN
jgi:xanthine/uracil permease